MVGLGELYRQQVEYNYRQSKYIKQFFRYPYSYVKARYYMFFAALLVWFLQRTCIEPNSVTKVYIALGIVSAILLASGYTSLILIGLFLVFSKGVVDWADGHLARLKKKQSLSGHILDVFGARVHSIAFFTALGFYQFQLHDEIWFLYLVCAYPISYALLMQRFRYKYLFEHLQHSADQTQRQNDKRDATKPRSGDASNTILRLLKSAAINVLDDRSRSIDLICLLIFCDQFTTVQVSWVAFVGVQLKWIVICCSSFFIHSNEKAINAMLEIKDGQVHR